MGFYEVWVRSAKYHGSEALTYEHEGELSVGQVVSVPMQRDSVLGFVSAKVRQPNFKTKPIDTVYDLPPLPRQQLELGRWLQAYYPAPLGMIAQQFLPPNLSFRTALPSGKEDPEPGQKKGISGSRSKLGMTMTKSLPQLTEEQNAAATAIIKPDTYLLHGATGSGKTRVYTELTLRSIEAGKSAIVLTPEISLTSQLAERFRDVFGDRVVILHSNLTPAERREVWLKILQSADPLIVIGPRSALFSPLKNVGLIVLDEAHEPAYKQEQAPHYQAGRVAAKLRELHDAILVLGSATPSVNDYFLAEQRAKPILKMTALASAPVIQAFEPGSRQKKGNFLDPGAPLPNGKAVRDDSVKVQVIDLKNHDLFPRSNYLSQPLIKAIEAALSRGEQTLLYLNRRGTARVIICENCGWQAMCPHCDLPLTYHGDAHQLRCHVCGFKMAAPTTCPDCGQANIIYKTIGTKAIVEEVKRLFPQARLQRFDTDNVKAERFEQHYEAVRAGKVDILIGTQLLAKGLDLPKLSVLGVLMADTSLQMPDYSASERTYQLLTQVLGRIGRGHIAGQAFVQTYQPDNPIIQAAIAGDWDSFYQTELAERKLFNFPPYVYLLKLTVRRASPKSAEKAAQELAAILKKYKLIIEGPAPAFHEKLAGKFQYQLILKSSQRSELIKVIANLPANWSYDIDPADLM